MPECGTSIYKTARNAAGVTIESAAHLLNIGETSLKDYERLDRLPSNATVARMAALYGQPILEHQHLAMTADGLHVCPEIQQRDPVLAACRVANRLRRVTHIATTLLDIFDDGVLDDDEVIQFDSISQAMDELSVAWQELKFAR